MTLHWTRFRFTGGLPSGEALWMGVPVVTCPQSQVVSRQTHALLHQIGLPELSATDADDYVRIATQLASIQFVDNELARLQAQAAALQTARMAYSKALQEALPVLGGSDTVKRS